MKLFSKSLSIGTVSFLALIVINTLWVLFHLERGISSKATTFLGITIDNKITSKEISTTFGVTYRTLITYLIFLAIVFCINMIIQKISLNTTKDQ
ncbi:hypothetical protein [Enterococcus hirae]|uniref:hypothetical protein n=1 Tax=Enterococcus hirae TaxID=1354 RepID=UPI001376FCB1|nr:hypothetical protein [Enterococcus hirae]NBA57115.1 hypothetical protein [Enterococcus hirae]